MASLVLISGASQFQRGDDRQKLPGQGKTNEV
jgi:hypothetical protein